jgi:hypothetical protein
MLNSLAHTLIFHLISSQPINTALQNTTLHRRRTCICTIYSYSYPSMINLFPTPFPFLDSPRSQFTLIGPSFSSRPGLSFTPPSLSYFTLFYRIPSNGLYMCATPVFLSSEKTMLRHHALIWKNYLEPDSRAFRQPREQGEANTVHALWYLEL